MTDVLIIGAGPCGLACALEARQHGLSHLVVDKGSICESIRRYPTVMNFFSTAENLEIGLVPFAIAGVKPNRAEALQYYRKVAKATDLHLRLFTTVVRVDKQRDGSFEVITDEGEVLYARNVVNATGYFDVPKRLHVPGEDLPHVSHYYDEAFRHAFRRVVVVGAGNSATEAALDLYRHDAHVTLIHRGEALKPTAKYWLLPDLRNRIKEGKIDALFNTEVQGIDAGQVWLRDRLTHQTRALAADWVYLLVGYHPDAQLFANSGVVFEPTTLVPVYNPDTFETNVPGLYLCGTVTAGIHTEKVFIENGRHHARLIVRHLRGLSPVETEAEIDQGVDVEEN